jgi:hypothetical protein
VWYGGEYAFSFVDEHGNVSYQTVRRGASPQAVYEKLHAKLSERHGLHGNGSQSHERHDRNGEQERQRGAFCRRRTDLTVAKTASNAHVGLGEPPRYANGHSPARVRPDADSRHQRKRRINDRRQPQPQYDDDSPSSNQYDDDEDDEPEPVTIKTERIKVGDEKRCLEFYEKKFKHIQQVPCKAIAKEWIKVIEPKKQTEHPYNGGRLAREAKEKWEAEGGKGKWNPEQNGEYSKPDWWPKNVKHKEPDHIKKDGT